MIGRGGRRHELILLEVRRGNNEAKTELLKLKDYFAKRNENYLLISSTYGSPKNALLAMIEEEVKNGLIANPRLFLFEVNQKMRVNGISSAEIIGIGALNTFEEFGEKFLGIKEGRKLA
jgi:hypothetical protein